MPPPENDVFLRALRREPTPYTPVWLMRQAGRYLPEYNVTRAKAGSFLALAKTPSLATEVTLQPLARFPLDAAILFSDILTVPDAMGLGLYFADGEGPRFERTAADESSIARLEVPDMARLRYVFDAVREIKRALAGRVPLIGFAGSPFTLACYMIEGAGSPDFATVRRMAHGRPDLLQRLVAVNARAVAAYLNEQIVAGADAVMLFDTWGGLLTAGSLPFVLAGLDAIGARRASPDAGRASHPDDRVHQGGRAVARRNRSLRGRLRRPRLDRRSCGRAPSAWASAWRCRAISIRSCSSRMRRRWRAKPAPLCGPPDPRPATSSILGTASSRRPRPKTSRRWSRQCTANRAQAAPVLDPRSASLGKTVPSRATAGSRGA